MKKIKMIAKRHLKSIILQIKEFRKNILLFREPILISSLLAINYYIWYVWGQINIKNFHNFIAITIVITYFVLSHKLSESFIIKFWEYVSLSRVPNKLTATLGVIDRIVYAACFVIQQYTLIGVWLGIKVAARLVEFKGVELTGDYKKDEEKIRPLGERKNIFIIGNLISLLLGIAGGYLIIILFGFPAPKFFKV